MQSYTKQEQDKYLNGFVTRQSFAGKATGIYLFKKKLTGDQSKQMAAKHCSTEEVSKILIDSLYSSSSSNS